MIWSSPELMERLGLRVCWSLDGAGGVDGAGGMGGADAGGMGMDAGGMDAGSADFGGAMEAAGAEMGGMGMDAAGMDAAGMGPGGMADPTGMSDPSGMEMGGPGEYGAGMADPAAGAEFGVDPAAEYGAADPMAGLADLGLGAPSLGPAEAGVSFGLDAAALDGLTSPASTPSAVDVLGVDAVAAMGVATVAELMGFHQAQQAAYGPAGWSTSSPAYATGYDPFGAYGWGAPSYTGAYDPYAGYNAYASYTAEYMSYSRTDAFRDAAFIGAGLGFAAGVASGMPNAPGMGSLIGGYAGSKLGEATYDAITTGTGNPTAGGFEPGSGQPVLGN